MAHLLKRCSFEKHRKLSFVITGKVSPQICKSVLYGSGRVFGLRSMVTGLSLTRGAVSLSKTLYPLLNTGLNTGNNPHN